jgi:hypothetical protein
MPRSGEPVIDPTSQNTSEPTPTKNIEDDMMTRTENTTQQQYRQLNLDLMPTPVQKRTLAKPIPSLEIVSEIVKRQNTLTKHFTGAKSIRAVVYVSNPKEIIKLFNDGVEHLQIIIGHKRVHSFRNSLDVPTVERMMELRSQGRLELFTSDKIHYHPKLYICEFEDSVKLINGSANLTRTGTGVSGTQWNHIWVVSLGEGYENHEFYQSELKKFEQYKSRTQEFFGDFADVFDQEEDSEQRIEIVQDWIDSGELYGLSEDADLRKVTRLIANRVMNPDFDADQTVVSIMPSASMKSLKKLEENLASIGLQVEGDGKVTLPRGAFLNHLLRHYPQATLNLDRKELFFGLGGKLISRTADELSPEQIDVSLQGIEDYVASILHANPENPQLAQRSVMEALLYILCTPFHSHYMRLRRSIYGFTEERGPRILHLWGGTSNGKSKLLNYASKLMTGNEFIMPLDGEKFSMTEVRKHLGWSSVYPMMWDDLTNDKWSSSNGQVEKVVKNYWDKIWTHDDEFPQLILTSNRMCPRGPLQTRIKEIHFASTYPRNSKTRKILASHLNRENRLFEFFTHLYIDHLIQNPSDYDDDEAHIGRQVMLELYTIAGRDVPGWFPRECLEEHYSPTSVNIVRALHMEICKPEWRHGELVLRFQKGMEKEPWVFKEYMDGIPNEFEVERKGRAIFFRRPEVCIPWLKVGYDYYDKKLPWLLRRKLGI